MWPLLTTTGTYPSSPLVRDPSLWPPTFILGRTPAVGKRRNARCAEPARNARRAEPARRVPAWRL